MILNNFPQERETNHRVKYINIYLAISAHNKAIIAPFHPFRKEWGSGLLRFNVAIKSHTMKIQALHVHVMPFHVPDGFPSLFDLWLCY